MIERKIRDTVLKRAAEYPVVTITGPRQSGKTTLAKACFPGHGYANLEDPETRELAETDYRRFFALHSGPLVIDEIQRVPKLASTVQTLVDERRGECGRFVLTGSHQPLLRETVGQSLAGRCALLRLLPLDFSEQRAAPGFRADADVMMFRGGMPGVAATQIDAAAYYRNYLQTYLERDVRLVANVKNAGAFNRFMTLLAGRIGQLLNLNSLATEVGVSHTTLGGWLEALEASFIIFRLRPYHANVGKRLVKTPKVYFSETGLAAALLGLKNPGQVARDPLRGGLFENMVVSELVKREANADSGRELYFFRTSSGLEVDVLRETDGGLQPIEIKSSMTWSGSLAAGLKRYCAMFPGSPDPVVAYGGATIPRAAEGEPAAVNFLEI